MDIRLTKTTQRGEEDEYYNSWNVSNINSFISRAIYTSTTMV